jgi:hypothetical protein
MSRRIRILDEIAAALDEVRGHPRPHRVVTSIQLIDQFERRLTPAIWRRFCYALELNLPSLVAKEDGYVFPYGWETVFDLAIWCGWFYTGMELPQTQEEATWREAQIFARVRRIVANFHGQPVDKIHRETPLADY